MMFRRLGLSELINRRNGRRRTLLGLIGGIWLAYGWAIFTSPLPNWSLGHLPSFVDRVLYSHWSGLLWALCALLAIVTAAFPRRCLPDSYGFNALLVPSLSWTVLYSWSWVIWVITRGHFGNPRSWVTAVMWSCAVVVLLITAGWPDPEDHAAAKNNEGR